MFLLTVMAGGLLIPDLGYPFLEPDEGRHAEIAREMYQSGDWIVPTLFGKPYFNKPALFYWLLNVSFSLLGPSEVAARLVPAGASVLTVVLVFFLGRRMVGDRAAFLAGLALCVTAGFVQCARYLVVDAVFSLFVSASLLAGYQAIATERFSWSWWLASAAVCGVAMLTKGAVAAVLIGPPLAAFGWLSQSGGRPRHRHWVGFAGLALGVAGPWYAAVILREPEFSLQFFWDHHLKRFFGEAHHAGPAWYYFPVLLIGCLPWSGLFLPWLRFLFSRSPAVAERRPPALGFCLLWAGWTVLFFSLSRGKLPTYVLPSLPPIVLLIGHFLDVAVFLPSPERSFRRTLAPVPRWTAVALTATWLAVNAWAWSRGLIDPTHGNEWLETLLCIACLVGLVGWGHRLPLKTAWVACGLLGAAFVMEDVHELVPAWSAQRSPLAHLEDVVEEMRDGATAVVCYGAEWGSIPFHLNDDRRFLNGTGQTSRQMKAFVGRHDRALVITPAEVGDRVVFECVPAGMAVSRAVCSGKVRIHVVERLSP